jgi:hypothetical protein
MKSLFVPEVGAPTPQRLLADYLLATYRGSMRTVFVRDVKLGANKAATIECADKRMIVR